MLGVGNWGRKKMVLVTKGKHEGFSWGWMYSYLDGGEYT